VITQKPSGSRPVRGAEISLGLGIAGAALWDCLAGSAVALQDSAGNEGLMCGKGSCAGILALADTDVVRLS